MERIKEILENFSGGEAIKKLQEETIKESILNLMDDPDLGISIKDLGVTLEDLNNSDYIHAIDENEELTDDSENFAKGKTVNLFRYVAHTSSGYGSTGIGRNSRSFCIKVSKRKIDHLYLHFH